MVKKESEKKRIKIEEKEPESDTEFEELNPATDSEEDQTEGGDAQGEEGDAEGVESESKNDLFHSHFGNQNSSKIQEYSIKKPTVEFEEEERDSLLIQYQPKPTLTNQIKQRISREKHELDEFILSGRDCFLFTAKGMIGSSVTCALNHIYKTRDLILKQTTKDQGFTRPKVLILLPFRHHCYLYVQEIIKQSQLKVDQTRFLEEFYQESEFKNKSDEYKQTFQGNVDDHFRLGIKFTRKTMSLYSSFYSSDLIICSPLGLHTILAKDFDYLSSIEVLVLDYADLFLMQNFEHLKTILGHLNRIPAKDHGTDFSRVKDYYLDGLQKYVRQTILRSDIQTPELNSLQKYCFNSLGKVIVKSTVIPSISRVITQTPLVFQRIPDCTIVDQPDTRFKYFVSKILPTVRDPHTLIVFPSYFDFIRVQNYLSSHNYSFVAVSEYTTQSKYDRSHHQFKQSEVPMMLMTERYHFFRRSKVKTVNQVVFYGPMVHGSFHEIVNMGCKSVKTLYSKYDFLALERIVGDGALDLVQGKKEVFMFSF